MAYEAERHSLTPGSDVTAREASGSDAVGTNHGDRYTLDVLGLYAGPDDGKLCTATQCVAPS